jgi:hypothetical protein
MQDAIERAFTLLARKDAAQLILEGDIEVSTPGTTCFEASAGATVVGRI